MGAHTIANANAMPAITWHRLRMNDVDIELPEGLIPGTTITVEAPERLLGEPGAFEAALAEMQLHLDAAGKPADERAVVRAIDPETDPHDLDVPAVSAYEAHAVREELANNVADSFGPGMGKQATAYLSEIGADSHVVLAPKAGTREEATIRIEGVDGEASATLIDVVAEPHSELDLTVSLDSPAVGRGLLGAQLRVFAGEGARVNVTSAHTMDESWVALDNTGVVLAKGARVNVRHRLIGGGKTYTGLYADLRGDASRLDVDTRYLAAHADERDINYIVKHRGKKTLCNIEANGVLMGMSRKTFRGTIDLVHGCKGSEGSERETVLLVDEKVDNQTIPVILCDEDDVAGNHGATIGHVRPSQLFYLGCRGLSPEAAEGLFATATLEEAALNIPDARVRAGVDRLADRLGVPYESVREVEE